MSPLINYGIITISVLISLTIFVVLSKFNENHKTSVPIILIKRLLFICFGALLIMTGYKAKRYYDYGAFYDDSYKKPDVESHLGYFKSEETEYLQSIYDKDPENFNFDLYPVIIVRYGCQDCETDFNLINANDDRYYIVHSRSDIGKKYVEHFNVISVPTFIKNGNILNYSSGYHDPDIVFPE